MMVVELSPQTEEKIAKIIASGEFSDAGEALDRAVDLLAEHVKKLEWLRAELAIGEAQEARGEVHELTRARFEEIKRQAKKNARMGKPIKDAVKPYADTD